MLRQRRQRFERLLRLRQRELDQKQANLARAQSDMATTRRALEEAQSCLRRAALNYRLEPGQSRSAEEFCEASAWLADRVKLVEQALLAQDSSKEKVRLAQLAVQGAEKEKRKISTLLERIADEERQMNNRREQIEQDEIAGRLGAFGAPTETDLL